MGDRPAEITRSFPTLNVDDYAAMVNSYIYSGNGYPGLSFQFGGKGKEEDVAPTYSSYAAQAYLSNGPIFACLLARASLFSEARFQWREFRNGRPGQLFGDTSLAPLERPWPNGTTGDLLVRMEQDYSLAGNFYGWRTGTGITRMRPDWVTIVIGSNMQTDDPATALDAEVVGYVYHPGGRSSGNDPVALRVEEVVHFTGPTPDPTARFRGMSWLTAIIRELQSDNAATNHKQKFFEQGGPKLAVSIDLPDIEDFQDFVAQYRQNSEGSMNAYKTLFFNSGTPQVQTVGSDLQQMDFKVVQGHGETRIASAAGVPPIVVGFSEGLESATYSNYALAMRRFADLTARPWWRMAAAALENVLDKPQTASMLWYDDRDIPALKDDIVNRAEVQAKQSAAAKLLVDAGFDPDSVIQALASDDMNRLVHSGLVSVQLQPPGAQNEQLQLPPARGVIDALEDALNR